MAEYYRIRKLTLPGGVVTTLAGSSQGTTDGIGAAAQFSYPCGVSISPDSTFAVTIGNSQRVRKIVISTRAVTTLAGSSKGFRAGRTASHSAFSLTAFENLFLIDTSTRRRMCEFVRVERT